MSMLLYPILLNWYVLLHIITIMSNYYIYLLYVTMRMFHFHILLYLLLFITIDFLTCCLYQHG